MADDAGLLTRLAPTVDGNLGQTAQFADEVLNVRAGASIDLGRVFTRQHGDPSHGHQRQFGAVGNPGAFSSSLSM
jgi:hypothetical protein